MKRQMKATVWGLTATLVLAGVGYAKKQKLPLPQQVMTAKTVYIDNRSGYAAPGDNAYDEIRKWGRWQVVDSPTKANVVLLISAKEYSGGYTSSTHQTTTGSVSSSGDVNVQTSGTTTTSAVMSEMTFITLLDPKSGEPLWTNARGEGRSVWSKSPIHGLVKELRHRINEQESRK